MVGPVRAAGGKEEEKGRAKFRDEGAGEGGYGGVLCGECGLWGVDLRGGEEGGGGGGGGGSEVMDVGYGRGGGCILLRRG